MLESKGTLEILQRFFMFLDESALIGKYEPANINPISHFAAAPDDTLHMLEIVTEYKLSAKEYYIAKHSALEAISKGEPSTS